MIEFILIIAFFLVVYFIYMISEAHRREVLEKNYQFPKDGPCRIHYFQSAAFDKCDKCGWSGGSVKEDKSNKI